MRRLREAIRLKQSVLWANNTWFLQHDIASMLYWFLLTVMSN